MESELEMESDSPLDESEEMELAAELLEVSDEAELEQFLGSLPATARALSSRMRRAAAFLRKVGIDIAFEREGRARTRTIRISCMPEKAPMEPSAPSAPSADREKGAAYEFPRYNLGLTYRE